MQGNMEKDACKPSPSKTRECNCRAEAAWISCHFLGSYETRTTTGGSKSLCILSQEGFRSLRKCPKSLSCSARRNPTSTEHGTQRCNSPGVDSTQIGNAGSRTIGCTIYEFTTRCRSHVPTTKRNALPIHRLLAGQAPSLARSRASPKSGKYMSMIGIKHMPKVQA